MTLALERFDVDGLGERRLSAVRRLVAAGGRGLWLAPIVAALAVTTLYPTVFLIALSLSKSSLGSPFRAFVGLDQFGRVLTDPVFLAAIGRSIVYGFVGSALQLVAGFAIALLFSSLIKGGRLLVSLVLLPLMTPPVMVGVAWKLILAPAGGLLNGWLLAAGIIEAPISFLGTGGWAWLSIGLADFWQWTPFIVILCFAALTTLPDGVIEASVIDGANARQRLVHIILPALAAPLASIFVLKLIVAFKLFDLVYVLTFGGPGFDTTNAGFAIWKHGLQEFDVAQAAAETLIYAVVIGLVTLPVVKLHAALERWDT